MNPSPHIKIVITIAALAGLEARAQDVEAGRSIYDQQCTACHSTSGSNGIGPGLKGVVGRSSAAHEGFRYSTAMKGFGQPWDAGSLDAFLANPQQSIPGNTMPFPGIVNAKQRADLIAYLRTLK